MKNVKSMALLVLILMVVNLTNAQRIYPKPPRTLKFVNDYANIISANAERQIEKTCQEYSSKTTIEPVVVTVLSLKGIDPNIYATNLFNKWQIGKSTLNNGIMLLIALKEHKIVLKPGVGLEKYYTKTMANRIIRVVIPYYFKKATNEPSMFDKGIIAGINAIIDDLGNATWNMRERHFAKQKKKLRKQRQQEEKLHKIAEQKRKTQRNKTRYARLVKQVSELEIKSKHKFVKAKTKRLFMSQIKSPLDEFSLSGDLKKDDHALLGFENQVGMFSAQIKKDILAQEAIIQQEDSKRFWIRAAFGGGVLLLILIIVWFYLDGKHVAKLKAELRKSYYKQLDTANEISVFFQEQFVMRLDYPQWATSRTQELLKKIGKLIPQVYDKLGQLDIQIDKKPRLVASTANIDGLDEMLLIYKKVKEEIPRLVRKYCAQAPTKVKELELLYDETAQYFKIISSRGFTISEFISSLLAHQNAIDELRSDLSIDSVVFKDVYDSATEIDGKINKYRTDVEHIVHMHMYVEKSLPTVQDYIKRVRAEYKEASKIWNTMQNEFVADCWNNLESKFGSVNAQFIQIEQLIDMIEEKNSLSVQEFLTAKSGMDKAHHDIEKVDLFLDKIVLRDKKLRAAKKRFTGLYRATKAAIIKAVNKARHSDVDSYTKEDIEELKTSFDQISDDGNHNWFKIIDTLKTLKSEAEDLYDDAKYDIVEAQRQKDQEDNYSDYSFNLSAGLSFGSNSDFDNDFGSYESDNSSPFGGGSTSINSGSVGGW